jgi:phosphate transport system substrate-binding protein
MSSLSTAWRWAFLALSFLSLATGCFAPTSEPSPPLRVGVCTSFRPLVDEIAKAGLWRIEVTEGPSRFILRGLEAGEFDLAIVALPVPGGTLVAKDSLAIVVHPSNRVDSLSMEELRRIYAGYVWDWSLLGWEGEEVVILSREDGSGARAFFEEEVMKGERLSPAAIIAPSSQSVLDYVASRPGAIGYVSASLLNAKVKALRLEGKGPSSPDYPLKLPAYGVAGSEAGRKLLEFLKGPAGRKLLMQRYFLP